MLKVTLMNIHESKFMSQVYLDGSTVGKKATEIIWLWSPDLQIGGWAPPQVHPSEGQPTHRSNQLACQILPCHTAVQPNYRREIMDQESGRVPTLIYADLW